MAQAQKKAVETEDMQPKGSLTDLQGLRREFEMGMDAKKQLALTNKLVGLFKIDKLIGSEKDFLKLILQMDRAKGKANSGSYEEQVINQIEKEACNGTCRARKDESIRHVKQGELYKFSRDFRTNMYFVYTDYVVKGKLQLSEDIVWKEERGHFPEESKYPVDRKEIHRIELKEKFFKQWFEVEQDELEAKKEEEYVF